MKLNKPYGAKQASSKNPLKKVFEVYFVKRNKRQEIRKKCPKLENRKKGKPYYLRLDYTMYHEKCGGHKFAQSLQN